MADITIRDIAKRCGVGVSTVSRALNNYPDISPATREKIMTVIRETGFVPNDSARSLKRTETNNIALLVKGITNPLFTGMIEVMEEEVEAHEFSTILRHVGKEEDETLIAQALVRERKPRGVVFLGGNFTHDEGSLERIGVPFVFATIGEGEEPKETGKADARSVRANIAIDDVQAGMDAVEYLLTQGHTAIGMIAEGLDIPSVGQLRYRGCVKALERHGLPMEPSRVFVLTEGKDHYSLRNGYLAAQTLLKRNPDLTAIFCVSDVLAIGACRAIQDAGLSIPADISVVGFDGIEMGEYLSPRLTTMRQPYEEIAGESIRLLFDMIENGQRPEDRIMNAQLVVRESTGPARTK